MKSSLVDLIRKTIVVKCKLPCDVRNIDKSIISTREDNCYTTTDENDLAKIIYNNIINYSFDTFEMKSDDNVLLKRALDSRIRYSKNSTDKSKLSFGFYGEVLLHSMLQAIYNVPPLISKGHFYIIGNGESKGYDSYHLVEANGQIHLWFGEVKFREQSASGIKSALENLSSKILTDTYFKENNIIPILDEMSKSDNYKEILKNNKLLDIQNKWIEKGELDIEDFKNSNIGIVYPILIAFDESNLGYDKSISNCIDYIKFNYSKLKFDDLSIDSTIFFIFLPLKNVKNIKKTVYEWIDCKEQLM